MAEVNDALKQLLGELQKLKQKNDAQNPNSSFKPVDEMIEEVKEAQKIVGAAPTGLAEELQNTDELEAKKEALKKQQQNPDYLQPHCTQQDLEDIFGK